MSAILKWTAFVGIHLLCCLAYILYFYNALAYRLLIVPLHLLLVGTSILAITILLGLLVTHTPFRQRHIARFLVALVPAVFAALLSSLYLTDYVSNRMWGANVNWGLVATFLPHFTSVVGWLPINSFWIYAALIAFLGGLITVYGVLSRPLLRCLETLFTPGNPQGLLRNRGWSLVSIPLLATGIAASGAFIYFSATSPHPYWYGEPIVGLFRMAPIFGDDPAKRAQAEDERRERAAYPKHTNYAQRNVVLILSDSMRADHMGVYGYARPTTPFLSSMVEQGRLKPVRFTASNGCESLSGILSTLSSRTVDNLTNYNFKINDLLWDQGYTVRYFMADYTQWYGYRQLLGYSMDSFFDATSAQRYPINDDRLVLEGLEQVPEYSGKPTFFFIFLMSTHAGGVKLPEYERYRPAQVSFLSDTAVINSEQDRQALINRYDNGIVQSDDTMRQIFAILNQKGYLANSIGAILADHGDGLGERGQYGHTRFLYQEDIRIPILLLDNSFEAYRNLDFATQIDVAPTLVSRLGLPVPASWEGHSLLDSNIREYTYLRSWLHGERMYQICRAVLYHTGTDIYKLLRVDTDGSPIPQRLELYNLTVDPGETQNLVTTAPHDLAERLHANLRREFRLTQ